MGGINELESLASLWEKAKRQPPTGGGQLQQFVAGWVGDVLHEVFQAAAVF